MIRIAVRAALAALAVLLAPHSARDAAAQDRRQNQPGRFDFYVLALSWSPSFCEAAGERGTPPPRQCGARPYSFVVHGLWPQYEHGYPEFCQVPAPRLDRNIVSAMLDLMPAPRLIFNAWDKHGTVRFKRPARSTLYAEFHVSPERRAEVVEAVRARGEGDFTWTILFKDARGIVHAEIDKTLYVADKAFYKRKVAAREAAQGAAAAA